MICETPTRKFPEGRTGTNAGYTAHRKGGEKPCEDCRKAAAAARRGYGYVERRSKERRTQDHLRWRMAAKERDPLVERKNNLKARFGLTLDDYNRLLDAQGGCCAICGAKEPGGRYNTYFSVDHDHSCCSGNKTCGKCVRGLLCAPCNFGLGSFGDDVDRLMSAAAFLLSSRNILEVNK